MKIKTGIVGFLFFVLSLVSPLSSAMFTTSSVAVVGAIGLAGGAIAGLVNHLVSSKDDEDAIGGRVKASDVAFTKPETKTITLVNYEANAVTIKDNASISSGVAGVKVGDIPDSCKPIPMGGKCEVELTSYAGAYGNGTITFYYGASDKVSANVVVDIADVTVTDVTFLEEGVKTATITNSSRYEVTLADGVTFYDIYGVTEGAVPDTCKPIASGGSCSVQLTASADAYGSGVAVFNHDFYGDVVSNVSVEGTLVTATNVAFTEPDIPQKVILTNNEATRDVTITGVSFSKVYGVTPGTIPASCKPISRNGGTCEVELTASKNASGEGSAYFAHDGFGRTISDVVVERADVEIAKVTFTEPGDQPVTLTNNGKYDITIGDDVTFVNVYGVSAGTVPSSCKPISSNGGACQITFTASADAYGDGAAVFSHDLLGVVSTGVEVVGANVTASLIYFDKPSTDKVTLTNHGSYDVTIKDDVSIDVEGVSLTEGIPPSCKPILSNAGTCEVKFTASENAYGSGTAVFDMEAFGKVSSDIRLKGAELKLQKKDGVNWSDVGSAQNIVLEVDPVIYRYVVEDDSFDWYKRDIDASVVSWKTEVPGGLVSLTVDPAGVSGSKCTESSISEGGYCAFELKNVDEQPHSGEHGVIKATGKNLEKGEIAEGVSLYGGLTLSAYDKEYHLGYRAIAVKNAIGAGKTATLINDGIAKMLDFKNETGKVKYCDPNETDCGGGRYNTGCKIGDSIDFGESCLIWLKALDGGVLNHGDNNITVDVSMRAEYSIGGGVTAKTDIEKKEFKVAYDQALYAGGTFTVAGTMSANRIAKWDGKNWSSLAAGVGGKVRALSFGESGDLYFGGDFTSPGRYIALWNGKLFNALGTGVGGAVFAIADAKKIIYVAGSFNSPGSGLAKWDIGSSDWSPLSNELFNILPVRAIAYKFGSLYSADAIYVGGDFTKIGNQDMYGVTVWNVPRESWNPLEEGLFDGVRKYNAYSFGLSGGGDVVGGNFEYVANEGGEFILANKVAFWTGGQWISMGSGLKWGDRVTSLSGFDTQYKVYASLYSFNPLEGKKVFEWKGNPFIGGFWRDLICPINSDENVFATLLVNINLYVGGDFITGGNVAEWIPPVPPSKKGAWKTKIGGGVSGGYIRALAVAPSLDITE